MPNFAEDLAALGNLRASSHCARLQKSLHPDTRLAEQTHRGPATGFSYGRGEGQTNIGAGPKLPSARSPF